MIDASTMLELHERMLTSPHIHAMLTAHKQGMDLDQAMAVTVLSLQEALTASQKAHLDWLNHKPMQAGPVPGGAVADA